ncbi:MAG: hypothetical protein WAV21_01945 [Minisyncoccia bacterium]
MDTRESNLAWWISGVLFILLIVVGFLWLSNRQSIPQVLERGKDQIQAATEQIAADCNGPVKNEQKCTEDLMQLSKTLATLNLEIYQARMSASSTVSGSATTTR